MLLKGRLGFPQILAVECFSLALKTTTAAKTPPPPLPPPTTTRTKPFNRCGFRAIPKGKDHSKCKALVSANVFFFVFA